MADGAWRRRALWDCASIAVTALAFVAGTAIIGPDTYALRFASGPTNSLDQPCAGVETSTVSAAVPSPQRRVETVPDGWAWTCRWRSGDTATLRTSNPTLAVTAERFGREHGGAPTQVAAKEYGSVATAQVSDARFGEDDAEARGRGLGIQVVEGIGDRAQVYVAPVDGSTAGYEANAVAVRGNVMVTARYVAYQTQPVRVRTAAVTALRQAVDAL